MNGQYTIAIIGLGFVGLPLANLFLSAGHKVYGIDIDTEKVNMILSGHSYVSDLADGDVEQMINSKRFFPFTGYDPIQDADAVIICVPSPLSELGTPDLNFIISAIQNAVYHLHPGQLIVLESSVYPGITEELVPIIEHRGFKIGYDIHLAYSPERIDPGRKSIPLSEIPKIIGGITPACTAHASRIYSTIFRDVIQVSSPRVAEMTKLLENTQRFINISFINEFSFVCERLNINVWEVIKAASTKPYGFTEYHPGPGVGGHCIPVDPLYLLWHARKLGHDIRFVELAKQINDEMPARVVEKVKQYFCDKGGLARKRILVLGVTYKKNVNDIRHSSALSVIEGLLASGFIVRFYDPFITEIDISGHNLKRIGLTASTIKTTDCVLILTDHDHVDYDMVVNHAPFIIDTRNVIHQFSDLNNT